MSKITRTTLADGIFLVQFETQYELAATFLRFQEHYESSRFSGRVFTLEEFMDWYASRFGNFTYYGDWSGFNVPSDALAPFYAGDFDPLLEKEKRLLRMFERERPPFYVIGVTNACSREDLKHELAHALYFRVPAYRHAVRQVMRGHDTSVLERELAARGYCRRVLKDEVHAYLLAGNHGRMLRARKLAALRPRLHAIFEQYGGAPLERVPRRDRPEA